LGGDGVGERGADEAAAPVSGDEGLGGDGVADGGASCLKRLSGCSNVLVLFLYRCLSSLQNLNIDFSFFILA
jgi:hypothetical protein